MAWDPSVYGRFAAERKQPFHDLVALVEPRPGMRVLDLGCGTGALTRELAGRLDAAEALGIDSSEAMLARSEAFAGDGVRFERGDIGALSPGRTWDLVLSHSALHWVDDHETLWPRLDRLVAPGGQLALQVPANHDHISHRVADELAGEAPFAAALGGYRRGVPVLAPRRYAELFHRLGYARQHVRMQIYGHPLASGAAVVDWVEGSLLTAFRARLDEPLYERFLTAYRERLARHVAPDRPYFYTYARILMWAARPGA